MAPSVIRSPGPVLALAVLLTGGCGPLAFPAVQRLPPEEQRTVDDMWNNMLAPADRLDRDVLLDTVTTYFLFHLGVDRLSMRSGKQYAGGTVPMRVDFDRRRPEADAFRIDVTDHNGRLVRSERYPSEEVFKRAAELNQVSVTVTAGDVQPDAAERAAADARQAEHARRSARVAAATQPAGAAGPDAAK